MGELGAVLDSALLFRRQRGALPQTFIFFVTSRCNARCDFCLYYAQITNPVAKASELTPEEVDRVASRYGPLHYLALSGGEPFVRSDVAALCEPFLLRCGTSVVDIPSSFYFGERMLEAVESLSSRHPGVVIDLQLSLDHVGEAHDASRKVPGLYARARESFAALASLRRQRSNVKLKINVVYLERNAEDLPRILERVTREFDADRIQLTYPHRTLPARGDAGELDGVSAYERAARLVGDAVPPRRVMDLHTLGVRSVKPLYHRLLREAVSGTRPTGAYCEAGRHVAVLDEKGEVFGCEPLWEPLGNVRDHDYDVGRILRGEAYARFRERRLGAAGCNCTWSCAMNTHVSVAPEHLPALGVEAGRIAASALLRKVRRG